MRKSICVISGETPTYIIMGITTGAMSAHCADPEVSSRLITATMSTKPAKSTTAEGMTKKMLASGDTVYSGSTMYAA